MRELLLQLAETNYSGAPFLIAYGITWIICGYLWKKTENRTASLATLFQGMVALPAALFVMYMIGSFRNRPDTGIIDDLVVIVAMSQLLVLPLLISMFMKKHYTLIPFVFSSAAAVHFLIYTWLYQTLAYSIMAILIALSLGFIYGRKTADEHITEQDAAFACFSTGSLLILNAAYLVISQIA